MADTGIVLPPDLTDRCCCCHSNCSEPDRIDCYCYVCNKPDLALVSYCHLTDRPLTAPPCSEPDRTDFTAPSCSKPEMIRTPKRPNLPARHEVNPELSPPFPIPRVIKVPTNRS